MAYFNNLTVGGTAKFLQDVKWPGLKSTVDELNYLHKETITKNGIDLLIRPYDYILDDEGMYAISTTTKLGFIAGNTYTLEVIMGGNTMTMTGIAEQGEDEFSSVIIVNFDGVEFIDNGHYNEDWDLIVGGSMWYYFPNEAGVTKYLLTGQGTNGPLNHQTEVYNKIPIEHFPDEIISKTKPIVTEISFDDLEYPYPVTGSFFNSYKSGTFDTPPYENEGFTFQPKNVDKTNKTFEIYAKKYSDQSEVLIGSFTSTSVWCPLGEDDDGYDQQVLGFYKDSSGKIWVRVLPLFAYSIPGYGSVDTLMVYKPIAKPGSDYNKCTIEFNWNYSSFGDIIEPDLSTDILPFGFTYDPQELYNGFFGQLYHGNSYNEEVTGNYSPPQINMISDTAIYAFSIAGKAEITIKKDSITMLGYTSATPKYSYLNYTDANEPGSYVFYGHVQRNTYEKESGSEIYEDLRNSPLYATCKAMGATSGSWMKITWSKE